MNNVTRQELVQEVSRNTGLPQGDTKIAMETAFECIRDYLKTGRNIQIRGFGTFLTKVRKKRPARNPKTGDVVPLPERRVPLFKFSGDLKKAVDVYAELRKTEAANES